MIIQNSPDYLGPPDYLTGFLPPQVYDSLYSTILASSQSLSLPPVSKPTNGVLVVDWDSFQERIECSFIPLLKLHDFLVPNTVSGH